MTKIKDLIARGETLEVEFKIEANDTELVEAVVCLANGGGGTLLVGVGDDGTVAGAKPRHGKTTDPRRVEALVSNSTRPSLGVQAELTNMQKVVTPVKTGVQGNCNCLISLDSGFRRNDENPYVRTFCMFVRTRDSPGATRARGARSQGRSERIWATYECAHKGRVDL